jgi:phage tail-like protein
VPFSFLGAETAAGWAEWELTNLEVVDGALAVATAFAPVPARSGVDAVDADADDCGNLYLLGSDGGLSRYDPRRDRLDRVACVDCGDDAVERATAVGVTGDSVFLAGSRAADGGRRGRVRALSRHLLQTRWLSDGEFADVVAVAADRTRAYVLHEDPESGTGRLAALRRDGTAEPLVDGLDAPVDIAVDDAGNCYVLDRRDGRPVVGWFEADAGRTTFADAPEDRTRTLPAGTTCIETERGGAVVAAVRPDGAGETVLYRYRFAGGAVERLAGFERRCSTLVARPGPGGGFFALDDAGDELYALEDGGRYRPRPHRGERESEYGGQAVARLDSGERGTEWHRVTLDRHLGAPGTQVRVRYVATEGDDPTPDLEAVDGVDERHAARLREAGVEGLATLAGRDPAAIAETVGVPATRAAAWIDGAWALTAERWEGLDGGVPDPRSVNPRDALVESATGRYLWVRLDLSGTANSSPRVGSFRAYFPRRSYLRHLPSVYREDEASAAFLERFLSVFESTFVGVEEDVRGVTRYFDPRGVPGEYLSWLGRWLAVELDETWPEDAKRELLARAPELFKKRGTREGLLATIGVVLDGGTAPAREPGPGPETPDAAATGDAGGGGPDAEPGVPATGTGAGTGVDGDDAADDSTGADGLADGAAAESGRDRLPSLLEHSDLDCIEDDAADARADYARVVGHPRTFVVLLDPSVDDEQLRAVERIVDAESPAQAVGRVVRLRPWVRLGTNAYLGVNSYLPTREFVLERSALGEDSVLVGREDAARLGLQSRLGEDSVIS